MSNFLEEFQRKKGDEKPWTIHSWDDLRFELGKMKPRSKLYEIVKSEVKKRGHWKQRPRKRS
jgi:hypothetical protein